MSREATALTVLIPARLASTRLPNKPLADIGGVPMVVRVAQRVSSGMAAGTRVVVAGDSESIVDACARYGVEAILTRQDHPSGSDRLAEACDILGLPPEAVVVNVQGDEPLIDPALVFTGPDGSVLNREQDLAAHAEGLLNLSRLDLSDTRYTVIGDMVLVTTKATLAGRFADAVIDGRYAYTRLWRETGSGWAVVAGQAARIG